MNNATLDATASLLAPELHPLVRLLAGASQREGQPWRLRPDGALSVPAVHEALALEAGRTGIAVTADALVAGEPNGPGTLVLSANAWRAAMAAWPAVAGQDTLLESLAALAPAIRDGAEVVSVSCVLSDVVLAQLRALPWPIPALDKVPAAPITDSAGLLAALAGAYGGGLAALLDPPPYDEANRYAALGVAIDGGAPPGDAEGSATVLIARALLAQLLVLAPGVADIARASELLDAWGRPTGVLRLDSTALRGATASDWVQDLVDQGLIEPGQVLHTALASAPTSLQAFNDALRAFASPGLFFAPGGLPQVLLTDGAQQALLAAVQAAAAAPLMAAAQWLDLGLRALEQARSGAAPVQAGWLTLGAELAPLVQPGGWPADAAWLRAALTQAGNVRQGIVGARLTGELTQPLGAGESLELQLGEQLFSSALGQIAVNGSRWSIDVPDDASADARAATLTRVSASAGREVLQRFELLDQQAEASVAVRLQALGGWYDSASAALGQDLAALLRATAAPGPGASGRDPVSVEALQALLGSGALQRVLASRGLVLPAGEPAQQLMRETLLAWAARAQSGTAYSAPAAVEAPLLPLLRPLLALDATARTALGERIAQAQPLQTLLGSIPTAEPTAQPLALALNLPTGATYTLQVSKDAGRSWTDAPAAAWQPELVGGALLLRVRDIVLPAGGSQDDFTLTLQATGADGLSTRTQVLLQDPARAHLQLRPAADGASAWAQTTLALTRPLGSAIALQLALSERGLDGSASPLAAGAFEVSRDGGQSWQAVTGSELTLAAGEQRVLLRHAIAGEGTQLRRYEWQLQASGAGASELGSTSASAQQRLLPVQPGLTLLARDAGQGEGSVVVALVLAGVSATEPHTLQLQRTPDALLQLGQSELSVDGGRSWQALAFDAQGLATLVLPAGRDTALVRTALQDLQGTADALDLGWSASMDTGSGSGPLSAPPASVRIWRHDAAQPLAWVSDLRIDAHAGGDNAEAVFTVRLSGPAGVPVTLDWASALPATGTAADPLTDFIAGSGHLVFGAGETVREVRVPLRAGWSEREAERAFELVLSNAVNARLGDDRATATLGGAWPHLVASGAAFVDGSGGDGFAHLQLGLSHASSQAIGLALQLLGDDADGQVDVGSLQVYDEASGSWADYVAASGVRLAAGQTTLRLRVPVNARAAGEVEADESLTLIVSALPASEHLLAGALQLAAPLALSGNADAPALQAQQARASFTEGAVFELRDPTNSWAVLSATQREGLRSALEALGLAGLLEPQLRERPDAQGQVQTVLAQRWLAQLRAAVVQQAQADEHRLLLDDLVTLGANAQPDAGQPGLLTLGGDGLAALLDRLSAAGLTVHRNAGLDDLPQPGALHWDGSASSTAQVSARTLAGWSDQLQRQQAREAALALRAQLALLVPPGTGTGTTTTDDALPIALGDLTAGQPWLGALADAGVLLLEPSDAAYDPEAVGAIFRRSDPDGVQRLYVSADTLTAWSTQLGVRAAWLNSTAAGGSQSFTSSYFNDQDPLALDHFSPEGQLDRLLLIYAVAELSRSTFMIEQAGERERVRLLANRFYEEVQKAKAAAAQTADTARRAQAFARLVGDQPLQDAHNGTGSTGSTTDSSSSSEGGAPAQPGLLDEVVADGEIPMREFDRAQAVMSEVKIGAQTLTRTQLDQLIAEVRYRSYLVEGELFSSAAASVVLLSAVAAAAQAARDQNAQGPTWAGAHDALLATQFLFQGLQQSLWLASQLSKPAPGDPPDMWGDELTAVIGPGREMVQAVLEAYAPDLKLWEAIKVYHSVQQVIEAEGADPRAGEMPIVKNRIPDCLVLHLRSRDETRATEPVWVDLVRVRDGQGVERYRTAIDWEGEPMEFEYFPAEEGHAGTLVLIEGPARMEWPFSPMWSIGGGQYLDRFDRLVVRQLGTRTAPDAVKDVWLRMSPAQRQQVSPWDLWVAMDLFSAKSGGARSIDPGGRFKPLLELLMSDAPRDQHDVMFANWAFREWLDEMKSRAALRSAPGSKDLTGAQAIEQATVVTGRGANHALDWRGRLRLSLGLPFDTSHIPWWFTQQDRPLDLPALYALARGMHITLDARATVVGPAGPLPDLPPRIPRGLSSRFKLASGVLGVVGDVVGVASAVAGVVAAAEALKALDAQGRPDTPEHRRARGQLIKELVVQSTFALTFVTTGTGNVVRLLQGVTETAQYAKGGLAQLMGASEFIGSRIAVAGLALGFATELVSGIAHATRWGQDPSHASDEDIYGTFGGLGNASAYGITLAITALAAAPEFAVIAMPLLMLLPDLSAVGRGHDTERRVAALRQAGRDAEADLMQTLAALAYREAAPVFGSFSALYAKEMLRYQLGTQAQQLQLLDEGAKTALENTAQAKAGAGTPNIEAGWTHGFLNFGAPINLVVPLNAYLTGDGAQIDWSSGLSADTDTFRAMAKASATHLQQLMGLGNWFERAFTERVSSQLLHWQSPQAWADQRALELADTSAVMRSRAQRDYSNQMAVDHGSKVTEDLYALYNQMAARLKQYFDAGQLRQVGDALYGPGSVYVGSIAQWRERAAQTLADDSRELPVEGEDALKARAQRYEASVMLAAYHDTLALAQVHAQRDAAIAQQGSALAPVDQWAALLRGAASASDLFVIASRAEAFALDPSVYTRTQAFSNDSAHTGDASQGNTEWVDGSYKLHLGQYSGPEDGSTGYWGGWQDMALPEAPQHPGDGASDAELLAYNQAVALHNERLYERNAHLASYLQSALARDADQRGADPGAPPPVLAGLAGVDPGASASDAARLAYDAAQASAQLIDGYNLTLSAQRVQLLEARSLRLQNSGGQTRFAASDGLARLGYTLQTRFSGNAANSVAERWVIRASELTRDAQGLPLGSEVLIQVLDEGGNTARTLDIDSSALDDVDQVFRVERPNVHLHSGDGDDSFVLDHSEGIAIDAGAGLDRVFFTPAGQGLTIDADRLRGVEEITGSEFDDVVSASGEQDLRYTDQVGLGLPTNARPPGQGDQVRLLGNGSHTVLIGAGLVHTGGGDDLVLVREHAGGSLELDLGGGTNAVSFALLPGVRLQRDFGTGDYRFHQVTWVLGDGSVGGGFGDASLGWGLVGTMRNVQQLIGSAMGDVFDIDGGIQALNAGGGDDRITLLSGDTVVDGGAGSDAITVHGAHNTQLRMDDAGDTVTLAASVQDLRIAIGARVLEDALAPGGAGIARGVIDARASSAALVLDIVDGTVRVKAGSGPLTINLLSASARVVIEDSAERVAAGAGITLNLLPGAPLDALGLRAQLGQDHQQITAGSSGTLSLLGGQVRVEPATAPVDPTAHAGATPHHRALQGMQLNASDLTGRPLQIALDQAVPVVAPSQPPSRNVSALNTDTPATTLHAWAGVRTVLDLQSDERFSGAYSAAEAQARSEALTAQRSAADHRQASAGFLLDEVGRLLDSVGQNAALDPGNTPVALAPTDLAFWATQGGARIERWVFAASDLLQGWRESLPALGWSAGQLKALDAALLGHAVYSAHAGGTLLISAATRDAWREQLQAVRAQTTDAQALGQLDWLDAQLAAVAQADARAGTLAPDLAQAQALLKSLLRLGVLSAEQAQVLVRVDLEAGWLGGDHGLRTSWLAPEQLPGLTAAPITALLASAGPGSVVFDGAQARFLAARDTLRQWLTDGQDQHHLAGLDLKRLDTELANLAPYLVRLASGAALYAGLANDTARDTLEVNSATPLQQALLLNARNGEDTASTPLWLQVDRFEGLTRVGRDDAPDILVASGAHANLLAGGRGSDIYTLRDDHDIVFENAGEGDDLVYGRGLSHALAEHVERLVLDHQGAPDAAVTLHGTGNNADNHLIGHLDFANLLDGRGGADFMQGGHLGDVYRVDDPGDVVSERILPDAPDLGGDDWVYSSIGYSLVEGRHLRGQIENLVLTGSAPVDATGNALDNRLRGNAGKNRIDGGAGLDTVVLSGRLQDYTFLYTSTGEWAAGDKVASRDNVDRFSRVEAVFFEAGGQTLTLEQLIQLGQTGAADVHLARAYVASYPDLMAAFGQNELSGLEHYFHYGHAEGRAVGFDPWRYMAANVDVADHHNLDPNASAGHYIRYGRFESRSTGAGLLIQQAGASTGVALTAQAGHDNGLFGSNGNDILRGSDGRDALLGGAGHDWLDGGAGDDRLVGGAGTDELIGGPGNDLLIGGTGADTYRFARGDGQDRIQEAGNDPGAIDRLIFEITGQGAIGYDQLWFAGSNGGRDLTISVMGTQDRITVQNGLQGNGAGVERITAADRTTADPGDTRTLSAANLQRLVSAMALLAPPAGATSWNDLGIAQRLQLQGMAVWT